jgi:hypothetical protein
MIKLLTILAQPVSASTETMFVLRYFTAGNALAIVVVALGFGWLVDLIDGVEHLYARHDNIPLVARILVAHYQLAPNDTASERRHKRVVLEAGTVSGDVLLS